MSWELARLVGLLPGMLLAQTQRFFDEGRSGRRGSSTAVIGRLKRALFAEESHQVPNRSDRDAKAGSKLRDTTPLLPSTTHGQTAGTGIAPGMVILLDERATDGDTPILIDKTDPGKTFMSLLTAKLLVG